MPKLTRDEYVKQGLDIVNGVYGNCLKKYQLYAYMSPMDLEDLKQDLIVQAIETIDNRFKPELGNKLSTFLSPRLHGYVKDFIDVHYQWRSTDIQNNMNFLEEKMRVFKTLPLSTIEIHAQDVPSGEFEDLIVELKNIESDAYEIVDAMLSLPEHRLEVLFGYYFLNKSIKEIAQEKGIDPSTGWVYKLKREGIQLLKEILRDRGVL